MSLKNYIKDLKNGGFLYICEIGGTVGDIESFAFFGSIMTSLENELGKDRTLLFILLWFLSYSIS